MEHNGKRVRIAHGAFPGSLSDVRGVTFEGQTEFFVLINTSKHPLRQRHALGHELAHIYLDHFDKVPAWDDVPRDDSGQRLLVAQNRDIEREANRHAWAFYRAYRDGTLPAQ